MAEHFAYMSAKPSRHGTEKKERTMTTKFYAHPKGATIVVFPDGTMDARNSAGRKKKTTATPENLASGHGEWTQVFPAHEPDSVPTPFEILAAREKL